MLLSTLPVKAPMTSMGRKNPPGTAAAVAEHGKDEFTNQKQQQGLQWIGGLGDLVDQHVAAAQYLGQHKA